MVQQYPDALTLNNSYKMQSADKNAVFDLSICRDWNESTKSEINSDEIEGTKMINEVNELEQSTYCTFLYEKIIPEKYRERPTIKMEDVQVILEISRSAAYALAQKNIFPILKIGHMVRVPTIPFFNWLYHSINQVS